KFVFSTSEAYLIEDGKITAPVKGATLIGNGPECMSRVSMVGNDLSLDSGVGTCGKDGQSVPLADVFEDFAGRGRGLVLRGFMLSLTDQRAQLLTVCVGVFGNELLQHVVGPGHQAVAPTFQIVEAFVVLTRRSVELIEQHQDFIQILIAHQLADELNVAFARNVRGVLGSIGQCPTQRVGQWQLGQHIGLECRQAFAQLHQSMQLSFDLGFAFLSVEGVVNLMENVMSASESVGPQALPALQQQVEEIVAEARRQGATACEVAVSLEQGLSTSVRQREVETVEFNRDQGFGITLYVGHRKGSASTSASGPDAIRETVAAALAIAKHTSEDESSGLADAALMAKEQPDFDLFHPWDITPEQAIERALICEAAAFDADSRIKNADGTTLNVHQGCRVYGNSHGFIGGYASTRHSLSCVMIAEGEGQMQRDYWYDVNRRGDQLMDARLIGQKAAERAASRLGARPVPTCEVPVLFSAELAGGLFGSFLGAVSGGNLYRKSSFLEGAIGQRLFPEWMTIDERPHLVGAMGSSAFDGDGLATYAKPFVENGDLVSYILSTYSGRKLGLPSTANAGGVHNLFVSHGTEDQAALIRRMGRGLLVTELMGSGLNMVTGDYSRGAAGFWIENGEIQFPVQEVTIAGNMRDMFKQIVAVGNDLEMRSNIRTGSVLIEKMMVAGS
nr:hypothetical protein [Tanacetum cinerariifolium]